MDRFLLTRGEAVMSHSDCPQIAEAAPPDSSGDEASQLPGVSWGVTAAERRSHVRCDDELPHPDITCWRGIEVDAPPALMFRWLCQLRVAPYSYDWLDNLGRQSPRTLSPGLERLRV